MFKYVKRITVPNPVLDTRSIEQKIEDLKKMGLHVSVRSSSEKHKDGYILGKLTTPF